DGGYIAVGQTNGNNFDISGNHGGTDGLVSKYNSTGVIEWKKCYGSSLNDHFSSVVCTADGGYLIGGQTGGNDGDVSGNHGTNDAWLIKINATGIIEWQKCYGSTEGDGAAFILRTIDGYIMVGDCSANNGDVSGYHGGLGDAWLIKINDTGTIQWQRTYGGSQSEAFTCIQTTSEGGYIVGGVTNSNDGDVTGLHGQQDFWVIKITSTGVIQWQKCLGGSEREGVEDLKQTIDAGYIAVGTTQSNDLDVTGNNGSNDIWVVKLDSVGSLTWQKCFGGSALEFGASVLQASNGNYIVSGTVASTNGNVDLSQKKGFQDIWILRIGSTGDIIWQKIIGSTSSDAVSALELAGDGGYILVGNVGAATADATGNTVYPNPDFWVIKLAVEVLPVRLGLFNVVLQNKVVLLKWQTETEINSSHFNIQRSREGTIYKNIGKVSAKGNSSSIVNYSFIDKFLSVDKELFYRLQIIDKDGKYSFSPIRKISNSITDGVLIFPNPAKEHLYVTAPGAETILITDATGKIIWKRSHVSYSIVDVKKIPAGIYFLNIVDASGNSIKVKQIIIEH
ncbi:MAG: T9SS type A sorting domain-containing protein, partial [Chitinophagaceae bacterium]